MRIYCNIGINVKFEIQLYPYFDFTAIDLNQRYTLKKQFFQMKQMLSYSRLRKLFVAIIFTIPARFAVVWYLVVWF